jgi:hypothetical protein
MGAWGVTLYASDTALDVRNELATWSRVPGTTDELVAAMTRGAHGRRDEADDDYSDFWLALADCLHKYGIEHAETFERARNLIVSGADLDSKRALGMSSGDVIRRRAVLETLLTTWSRPAPKPRKRRLMSRPEPHAFPVGSILVYPTDDGEPKNFADVRNLFGWAPDGWASAVVLAQGHERGYFAWECLGRIGVHGAAKPTLAACLDSGIENQPWWQAPTGRGTLAVDINALTPLNATRMQFESIGRVELDDTKVVRLHPPIGEPKRVPFVTFQSLLAWRSKRSRLSLISKPRPVVPLRSLMRA